MKTLLFTGASSFIGKGLISELNNYKIKCLVRRKLNVPNCEQILFSVKDLSLIDGALKGVDCVVHFAGITNSNHPLIEEVNLEFTKNLVRFSKKQGVKKFIFLSSDNVNYDVNDRYTDTKKKAEEFIRENFDNYLIVRPTIIYGGGEEKYVGKIIKLIKKSFFVPIIGSGNNEINLIYLKDLVYFFKEALKNDIKGTFTLSGPETINYNSLIDKISEKMDKKVIKIHVPIWLLKFPVWIYSKLVKNPYITAQHLKNIKIKREKVKNNYPLKKSTSISGGLSEII